ncbi:unnamed protein product [Rotaria sp. Silwood2]|nr:unnamed protein product [Rotaria sp. Silwood2]CAF3016628.1 unnamed protein product [Rotaria sp. Silwood2]CAF3182047.1 unnamed protein product [Rotaria sp. Silwood2]CAF4189469.1 unnamed protein product [Rotaria sp. Silwood2]CAF4195669.1 unnamed protein product [Rotaria sp. Silwood2]
MCQYDKCSTNSACGCFRMTAANDTGICGVLWLACSQLVACGPPNNVCYQPGHICVHHPRCFNHSICYPLSMTGQICPPLSSK